MSVDEVHILPLLLLLLLLPGMVLISEIALHTYVLGVTRLTEILRIYQRPGQTMGELACYNKYFVNKLLHNTYLS